MRIKRTDIKNKIKIALRNIKRSIMTMIGEEYCLVSIPRKGIDRKSQEIETTIDLPIVNMIEISDPLIEIGMVEMIMKDSRKEIGDTNSREINTKDSHIQGDNMRDHHNLTGVEAAIEIMRVVEKETIEIGKEYFPGQGI